MDQDRTLVHTTKGPFKGENRSFKGEKRSFKGGKRSSLKHWSQTKVYIRVNTLYLSLMPPPITNT